MMPIPFQRPARLAALLVSIAMSTVTAGANNLCSVRWKTDCGSSGPFFGCATDCAGIPIGVYHQPGPCSSGGSFNLSQLPPGEYVIEAWHSRLGTQQQTVTVATGQTAEVSFTFTE